MSLLAPLGLLALGGLLLPLLIHLQRQIQREPVSFAALRWLSAAARPRRRLRLQQWLLLLLRLLLIALMALMMAQPVWQPAAPERLLLVHPALSLGESDGQTPEIQSRWLAPGFPRIESPPESAVVDTASLLREIDAQLPLSTELRLRLPATLDGMDGERLALRRQPVVEVVQTASEPPGQPPSAQRWSLRFDDPEHPALDYLRAGMAALSDPTPADQQRAAALIDLDEVHDLNAAPGQTQVLWWASEQNPAEFLGVADWLNAGGVLIWLRAQTATPDASGVAVWHSADGERTLHARRMGLGWLLQASQVVDAENFAEVLQPGFPALLQRWADPQPLPANRIRADALQPRMIEAQTTPSPQTLQPPLLWLILIVLIVERLLALGRQRARR